MLSPITTLAKWLYVRWPLLQNHFALFSKELGSLPWKKRERERHPPLMTQGTSLSCCLAIQSSDARCYTSLQVAVTHSQEMVSRFRALVRTCWLKCCVSCQAHSVPLTFLAGHHQHERVGNRFIVSVGWSVISSTYLPWSPFRHSGISSTWDPQLI